MSIKIEEANGVAAAQQLRALLKNIGYTLTYEQAVRHLAEDGNRVTREEYEAAWERLFGGTDAMGRKRLPPRETPVPQASSSLFEQLVALVRQLGPEATIADIVAEAKAKTLPHSNATIARAKLEAFGKVDTGASGPAKTPPVALPAPEVSTPQIETPDPPVVAPAPVSAAAEPVAPAPAPAPAPAQEKGHSRRMLTDEEKQARFEKICALVRALGTGVSYVQTLKKCQEAGIPCDNGTIARARQKVFDGQLSYRRKQRPPEDVKPAAPQPAEAVAAPLVSTQSVDAAGDVLDQVAAAKRQLAALGELVRASGGTLKYSMSLSLSISEE